MKSLFSYGNFLSKFANVELSSIDDDSPTIFQHDELNNSILLYRLVKFTLHKMVEKNKTEYYSVL